MTPALSVLMSVYNGERFLAPAIESVLTQDFGDFEFLIVDDGSTDRSAAILADYANRDARLQIVTQENAGLVAGLNVLLEKARAPLVARMDADDLCLPERFTRQIAFLAGNPEIGALGTHCSMIDHEGNDTGKPILQRPLDHAAIMDDPHEGILLLHPTLMVRTELLRRIGGYRAPFRTAQDYDLYLRLAEVTQLANLPDILLRYRVHSGQASCAKLVQQTLSAAAAWHSHEARLAGRDDPVDGLTRLPALDDLDALFGRQGIAADARKRIVDRVLYSPAILAGDASAIFQRHVRESASRPELWRAAARLGKAGHVGPALRTVAGLVGASR